MPLATSRARTAELLLRTESMPVHCHAALACTGTYDWKVPDIHVVLDDAGSDRTVASCGILQADGVEGHDIGGLRPHAELQCRRVWARHHVQLPLLPSRWVTSRFECSEQLIHLSTICK